MEQHHRPPFRSMESSPLRSNGDTPNHHHNHHPLAPALRMALYDYDAQGEDELTLRKGQIVEVLSEDAKISGDEGWWTGKIGDKVPSLGGGFERAGLDRVCLFVSPVRSGSSPRTS